MKGICLEWSRDRHFSPSLATGVWNLAPKATSGPKFRGESCGTTLWRHVQRYFAQFLLFMVIHGNLVLWGYNWNRQQPSLSCPRLFLWTLESFQVYCMEEIAQKCLLVVKWPDFKKCEKWPFLNILQRLYIVRQNCQKCPLAWMKQKSTTSETRQKSFLFMYGNVVSKDSRNLYLPSVVVRGEEERPWIRGCGQITYANFNGIKILSYYACAYVYVDFLLTL